MGSWNLKPVIVLKIGNVPWSSQKMKFPSKFIVIIIKFVWPLLKTMGEKLDWLNIYFCAKFSFRDYPRKLKIIKWNIYKILPGKWGKFWVLKKKKSQKFGKFS